MVNGQSSRWLVEPGTSPLIDRRGDGYIVTESTRKVVTLDRSRRRLLGAAAASGQRCILLTGERTMITRAYAEAAASVGACWVVRSRHGLRDALTGRRLHKVSDVIAQPEHAELAPEHAGSGEGFDSIIAEFSCSIRQRNTAKAEFGGTLEALAEELLEEPELSWGSAEPTMVPWEGGEVSTWIRSRLQFTPGLIANAVGVDGRRLTASLSVRPTNQGAEEIYSVAADLGPVDSEVARERLAALPDSLALTANEGVPLFGTAHARYGRPDLLRSSTLEMPSVPMAMIIGAPGVSQFDIDADRLADEFDAFTVGQDRKPSLVIGFGQTIEAQNFVDLRDVVSMLGPQKIADAFGADFLDSLVGRGWRDHVDDEAPIGAKSSAGGQDAAARIDAAGPEHTTDPTGSEAEGQAASAATAVNEPASGDASTEPISGPVPPDAGVSGSTLPDPSIEAADDDGGIDEMTLIPPEDGWDSLREEGE